MHKLKWHASARVRVILRSTTAAVPPARDAGVLGRALDPDFQAAGGGARRSARDG
jgi:hypothetical protein